MPFDSTTIDKLARRPRARVKLTTKRARLVIAALRDHRLRPIGFRWNYADCPTCAIGLTGLMFGASPNISPEDAGALLGLNAQQRSRVFSYAGGPTCTGHLDRVPAALVAEVLEACVVENEQR